MFLWVDLRRALPADPSWSDERELFDSMCEAGIVLTPGKDCEASEPGYTDAWYARIVADGENAEHYAAPASVDLGDELNSAKLRVLYKQPRGQ